MKKLPIGIQSFEKIRSGDYYYVDKTPFVARLAEEGGGWYFLSRPRRFGKSLFLDTLRQAFLGRKELFDGLYLETHWDWSKKYPVVYISFDGNITTTGFLEKKIRSRIKYSAEDYGISLNEDEESLLLEELIMKLNKKYNSQVVVLIDEYDKPILDAIDKEVVAIENREKLKNLYGVLKPLDAYLKFVFITGVSKFSKVSLFSGLNQLNDITLDEKYSTICGYTQSEFEKVFEERLTDIDFEKIRCWDDGYSWLGESVYNPFDILLYLDKLEFRPYWFETGTPTFLIKLMDERKYYLPRLAKLRVGEELIGSFDVDRINPENLLFQTGYLTIVDKEAELGTIVYTLSFPNKEVEISFNNSLLNYLVQDYYKKEENKSALREAVRKNDIDGVRRIFQGFFSSIPHDWYRRNEIYKYEGYYASVVYAYFSASGFDVVVEDATSVGKIDMTVLYGDRVYVMEFKVVELEGEGKAITQLKGKRYWEKYADNARKIYLVGVEFSRESKNIAGFDIEEVK